MGARQAGVEHATGEVIVLIDDDVEAEPGLVAGHARHHAVGDGLVVLGYMPVELGPVRGPGDFATALYAQEYEQRCAAYERDPGSVLTHLWAGNISLRRSDCLRVGLDSTAFSERYHPDRELGLRLLKAGLTGVFDRGIRARHLHSRSLEGFLRDARSQGAGRLLVHRLHEDVLGPMPPDFFERDLPAPGRALVGLARRPLGERMTRRALAGSIGLAGRVHWYAGQETAAKLARRVEQDHGSRAAAHRAPAGSR
jgi:glycosyltransferase involved in cell wall biosynthesis